MSLFFLIYFPNWIGVVAMIAFDLDQLIQLDQLSVLVVLDHDLKRHKKNPCLSI